MNETYLWIGFSILVPALLLLDLLVFNRKAHEIQIKEALLWTMFWIGIALTFNLVIFYFDSREAAVLFFTAYLIEKSLSMDNLFVFLLIFQYFKVNPNYQHKVLFWGIIGALFFRGLFIFAGVTLIQKFHWIIYIFGAFLIFTGIKMLFQKEKEIHPEKNPVIKIFKKFLKVHPDYEDGKFFVKIKGYLYATPLFIVILFIETTDIIFAVDSIPAVLAISHDPFIVYTSNVMAILGLRALYFALAGIMRIFRFLNYGLSVILVFVGIKMLISEFIKIPTSIALGSIAGVLFISVLFSVLIPDQKKS
ncbi:MAG: TerC family protein [Spirochaetes bacterium]|jgi:tellurite resistance protein TerC|nr:TerC family protein [Spirochaetota bacterium]